MVLDARFSNVPCSSNDANSLFSLLLMDIPVILVGLVIPSEFDKEEEFNAIAAKGAIPELVVFLRFRFSGGKMGGLLCMDTEWLVDLRDSILLR